MTPGNETDRQKWSTIVPNTATEDRGDIRRSKDPLKHPELGFNGCRTLYEGFRRGHSINPLGPCLGFRAVSTSGFATPFVYSSYTEVLSRVECFAAGLDTLELVPPNDDGMVLIGLYMKNCMDWFVAEQGIFCLGGATVPFYDTLGPESVQFILNQTATPVVVCSRQELQRLCQVKQSGECPAFRTVILADGITPDSASIAKHSGLQLFSFAKVEAIGAETIATKGHKHRPPSPKDVFTFCYTSGTTGNPKGALLTHENLISSAAGADHILPTRVDDRHLSYLPLAHIFERVIMAQIYIAGASVAFYRGDPLYLIEDIQACRPTILPAVPRVLNKIYDKIIIGITAAGGMKKRLFDRALATKMANLTSHGELRHSLYDRLIFSKIKKGLGLDQLRVMVSGSAPLSRNVMFFYRCMLGVPVLEGYGQTEASASEFVSEADDMTSAGHVGGPTPAIEAVLVDVPEMGYLHTDTDHKGQRCQGRGEIWVRGPTVFKGYYKEDEKTKETIDDEGWLHSGDIGLWTAEGQLQIIDRKKNIFKLSQGEYVAPEKIENILIQSLYIAQAFVYGDSFQNSLVAVIVPDEEPVRAMIEKIDPSAASGAFSAICNDVKLKELLIKEIRSVAKKNGLHGFEIPKAIHLEHELFSVENGVLTPTFKLKRQQALGRYQKQIESMYASLPQPVSKL